jgi:hypothetical protein
MSVAICAKARSCGVEDYELSRDLLSS